MKKTYIAPKAVAYNVNAKCETIIVCSQEGDGNQLVKGQEDNLEVGKGDNSVSIWDLY